MRRESASFQRQYPKDVHWTGPSARHVSISGMRLRLWRPCDDESTDHHSDWEVQDAADQNGKGSPPSISTLMLPSTFQVQPTGVQQSITLIVSFHPIFITEVDKAYRLHCSYVLTEKRLTQHLEVRYSTSPVLHSPFGTRLLSAPWRPKRSPEPCLHLPVSIPCTERVRRGLLYSTRRSVSLCFMSGDALLLVCLCLILHM